MRKQQQQKSKKPECVGTGKITPVQVAFIVDRYLSDNAFTQTSSSFRSEASHLISKSPVREAPKSLMTLGDILEEYVTLKEKKLFVERERCRLEQENVRVKNFLDVMHNVMTAYNAAGPNPVYTPSPQLLPPAVASGVRPQDSGGPIPMYKGPMVSVSRPLTNRTDANNLCTPVTGHVTTKRKGSKSVSGDPVMVKKSRSCTQPKDTQLVTQVTNANCENYGMNSVMQPAHLEVAAPSGSQAAGSSVVKCLFNQKPQSPPVNSSVPKTPPQDSSSGSDKPRSPSEICSTATCSKQITPQHTMSTNRTIISSETIQVSPTKQISYYSIEKNSCISTCSPVKANTKWSNVKGRLNFDASEAPVPTITENQSPDGGISTSESGKEGNVPDFDILNLEDFGAGFDLSDFLLQFDMGGGLDFPSYLEQNSSPDSYTSEPAASGDVFFDGMQQFSSEISGVLSDKDMNAIGPDSITTMRSVSKCIILSPVKSQRSSRDQENTPARN